MVKLIITVGVRDRRANDDVLSVAQLDGDIGEHLFARVHDAVVVDVVENMAADGGAAWQGTIFQSFQLKTTLVAAPRRWRLRGVTGLAEFGSEVREGAKEVHRTMLP